ncbi:ribonuclease H-like domain-containing protein [Phaeosphaeriaceae sp. PMI808]|nr:ribonuclease H-like domain-containing protein [Phaeosphaeriaceae sp. PMI808]
MARVRKENAKQRQGLEGRLGKRHRRQREKREQSKKLVLAPSGTLPRRPPCGVNYTLYNPPWARLPTEVVAQERPCHNSDFKGSVMVPSKKEAREPDSVRLADIVDLIASGDALVFWADGSYTPQNGGHAAAGVVDCLPDGKSYGEPRSYSLGGLTADANDAEMYGIFAALHQARARVEQGANLKIVRIYTDSMTVLQLITKGTGKYNPLLHRKLLRLLYDQVDWLVGQGVLVELTWVKGHAGSLGNQKADKAAKFGLEKRAGEVVRDGAAHGDWVVDVYNEMKF